MANQEQLMLAIKNAVAAAAQYGVKFDETMLRNIVNISQLTDCILYAGHLPVITEVSHKYFSDIAAGENDDTWTNIDNPGRLPFTGTFKISGLGMLITPLINDHPADIIQSLNGSLNFKVGSREGTILKLPLSAMFTQEAKCCVAGSATGQNLLIEVVSASPFGGKFGFLPLPNAPRISENVKLSVDVRYRTAWAATSNLSTFFFIFGKQETPMAE
jgi:hypothetical protein